MKLRTQFLKAKKYIIAWREKHIYRPKNIKRHISSSIFFFKTLWFLSQCCESKDQQQYCDSAVTLHQSWIACYKPEKYHCCWWFCALWAIYSITPLPQSLDWADLTFTFHVQKLWFFFSEVSSAPKELLKYKRKECVLCWKREVAVRWEYQVISHLANRFMLCIPALPKVNF